MLSSLWVVALGCYFRWATETQLWSWGWPKQCISVTVFFFFFSLYLFIYMSSKIFSSSAINTDFDLDSLATVSVWSCWFTPPPPPLSHLILLCNLIENLNSLHCLFHLPCRSRSSFRIRPRRLHQATTSQTQVCAFGDSWMNRWSPCIRMWLSISSSVVWISWWNRLWVDSNKYKTN